MIRLAIIVLLAFSTAASAFPARYDRDIRASVRHWLPMKPWKLLKAQLYQESRLDPLAVSPVGARGLGQFMAPTWREVSRAMGWGVVSPADASLGIQAAAYYMARLRRGWSSPRPERDRYDLALASYNAGFGSLLKAQRKCGGPAGYPEITACLPQVTGRHARETLDYVPRIRHWHARMEILP